MSDPLFKIDETTRAKLQQVVSRVENLEEEKKAVSDQIADIFAEAKAIGFDTKAIKSVIRLRKIEKAAREEQEMILETYLIALGEA